MRKTIPDDVYKMFRATGSDLFLSGLVAIKSGNMSIRRGGEIIITTHGAILGRLKKGDLIRINMDTQQINEKASMDAKLHLEIYQRTPRRAIVHAHPSHATLLSQDDDEIEPFDIEGKYYFPKVTVVPWDRRTGKSLSTVLKQGRIAVARAHGTFAVGDTLDDALFWTTSFEHSCQLLLMRALAQR